MTFNLTFCEKNSISFAIFFSINCRFFIKMMLVLHFSPTNSCRFLINNTNTQEIRLRSIWLDMNFVETTKQNYIHLCHILCNHYCSWEINVREFRGLPLSPKLRRHPPTPFRTYNKAVSIQQTNNKWNCIPTNQQNFQLIIHDHWRPRIKI